MLTEQGLALILILANVGKFRVFRDLLGKVMGKVEQLNCEEELQCYFNAHIVWKAGESRQRGVNC